MGRATKRRRRQSAANNPYLAEAKRCWPPAAYRIAVECMNRAANDEEGRELFRAHLQREWDRRAK